MGWELRRDRLISLLHARWDHPITTIIGGAGVGKTVALRQMMAANRLSPRGTDVWVPASDLSNAAVDAAIAAAGPPSLAGEIVVVVDDAANAVPDQLTALCARTDLRVVLASRGRIPAALSRWDLAGEVLAVDGDALLFDAAESATAPFDVADWSGWIGPAVLAERRGRAAATGYVAEEVLAALDDQSRALLGLVTTCPGVDDQVASLVFARAVSISAELVAVPTLSLRVESGTERWAVGDIWGELMPRPDAEIETIEAVASALEECDRLTDAVQFVAEHRPPRSLARLQRRVALDRLCVDMTAMRTLAELGQRTPARILLEGLVARSDSTSLETPLALYVEAAERAEEEEDWDVAMEAVGSQGLVAYLRHDFELGAAAMVRSDRLSEFASPGATAAARLAPALINVAIGQEHEAVAIAEAVNPELLPRHWRLGRDWVLGWAYLALGDPRCAEHARAAAAIDFPFEAVRGIPALAEFRVGNLAAIDTHRAHPASLGDRLAFAMIDAALGWSEAADRQIGEASDSILDDAPQVNALALVAHCWIALGRGDADDAQRTLTDGLERLAIDGSGSTVYRHAAALFAELLPDGPDPLDGLEGELFDRDRRLLAALAAAREGEFPLDKHVLETSAGEMVGSLGLRGAVELSLAAAVDHPSAGLARSGQLMALAGIATRDNLREFVDHPVPEISRQARRVLVECAAPPTQRYELRLLGPTRWLANGVDLDHENWRRERVRALLAYLAAHRRCSRESVITALWPDADPEAGRNRFRSTLNRLLSALEPERLPGEASAIIGVKAGELTLELPADAVDVWRFESTLDRAMALDCDGVHESALEQLVSALSIWRGEYLEEQCYEDWAALERERLRGRFTAAASRAAELMLAGAQVDAAIQLLHRLVAAEPWSERGHRLLIHAYAARGDRAGLQRAMTRATSALAEIGGAVSDLDTAITSP